MKNKAEEIQNFLIELDIEFDAICISETWLKDEIVKYYGQENYKLFASCRSVGAGGGTAIYFHSKHETKPRRDLESVAFETTFVQIILKGTNPALKKPSNIPEIYAKMFGRFH